MVDVAAGGAHSACVTAAGGLYTWGKGRYGRLGHSDSEDQLKPKLVRGRGVGQGGALPAVAVAVPSSEYFPLQVLLSFRVGGHCLVICK